MQIYRDLAFTYSARFYTWMTENPIWHGNSARLLEGLPLPGESVRVVDLGAGPGNSALSVAQRCPNGYFLALDLSFPMLALAQQRRQADQWAAMRLAPLQGNASQLPLSDASVDAVMGHSFLYMLPNLPEVLSEVHRVVRPKGVVAFLEPLAGVPDWGWLGRQRSTPLILSLLLWRVFSRMHRRFTCSELKALLYEAGFQHVQTEVTLGNFALFGRGQKP
jgi:ubiquinone/menaquinone biosynthesis C-methylase UbiE